MEFWIFMLIMDLLIPITMIGFGRLFMKKTPQKINFIFGYRTSMSMKNNSTWTFAHHYCGKLWFRWGLVLLPVTIVALCFVIGKDIDMVGKIGGIVCFVQMIPLVGVIFPTEYALRRTFDIDGNQRNDS
ncbi:MAG: SdpI family protein [Anaerocolumna sp.]